MGDRGEKTRSENAHRRTFHAQEYVVPLEAIGVQMYHGAPAAMQQRTNVMKLKTDAAMCDGTGFAVGPHILRAGSASEGRGVSDRRVHRVNVHERRDAPCVS